MRAPPRPVSEVKGLWFSVGRRYIVENGGEHALHQVLSRMPERDRAVLSDPIASAWYPEETLQQTMAALDVVIARENKTEFTRIMEECSVLAVNHFFRALMRLVPAPTMLRKVPTMWNLIRRGAGRVVVEAEGKRGTVSYSEFPFFDDVHYRLLTIGALRAMVKLCGIADVRAEVVTHGHDALVVEVRW